MCAQTSTDNTSDSTGKTASAVRAIHRSIGPIFLSLLPLLLFVGTAAAQSNNSTAGTGTGSAFCGTNIAATIENIFAIIQFGGPLVGGVLALGATVAIPFTRRSDWKKEMKTVRNQGLLWGVIVAPLGTEIVQFILNNIVVGGTSCGF
ncbi:hypothetical protein [Halorhabdus amylolytica]|uniref:hypothetical protein n=1 Tax=Halorhabdus amylolytica TaxID=2559573 RepID=UPI0010AA97F7|nr:hypothetical protein [Halorhabdus amylolytica]